ncbi:hypothetical protein FSP39_020759 [Pinctada imbricata]|uniref:Cadherin domain-containing protein n=1 Tax=Pinctada imbricata TaxID=66713 RepID=A0AA88YKD3_PINIB|nr:hypothetical protein FSP39_020759 [Pinctada imbricata]
MRLLYQTDGQTIIHECCPDVACDIEIIANAIYVKAGASFDYDSVRQYDLTVSCTDQTSSVTGTYTVFIIPNEEPVITNLAATTQVSTTSTTIGDDIFTVTSTDTENDQLHYNMTCVPSGCPFTIYDCKDFGEALLFSRFNLHVIGFNYCKFTTIFKHANPGLIECTADLTGHSQAGYDLYVYVYDGYTLVGPRVLTITMTDQNSVPVISNLPFSSALSLQENSAIGTSVFQTQVTDLNLGDNLVYSASYSPTTGASIFQTDTSTGLVSTSANIDYEALSPKTYTVTITVNDGQDSDTESLQISIIDVNEAPVFAFQQYTLTGNEGQTGDVIGTPAYGVTDPDSGDTHTYSIDCTSLNIDSSSGQISLATDYDLDISGTSDTISCNVTVSDGALSDTATVIVTLLNVNDNTPTFTFSTYTFYCDSNDGVGTTIGTAAASDADIGTNGDISYSLDQSSLPAEYYGVQQTGEIFIKSDIGYIYNRTDYVFQIIATDTGGLFGSSNVTVICQGYSTLAPINVTERYITFFEDTRNLPWFVVMMAILASVAAFVAFLLVKAGCCNICRMVEDYFQRRRWNLRRQRREQMKNKNRTDSPVSLISASPAPPSPYSLRSTTPRSDIFSQKPSSGIWDPWTNSSDLLK